MCLHSWKYFREWKWSCVWTFVTKCLFVCEYKCVKVFLFVNGCVNVWMKLFCEYESRVWIKVLLSARKIHVWGHLSENLLVCECQWVKRFCLLMHVLSVLQRVKTFSLWMVVSVFFCEWSCEYLREIVLVSEYLLVKAFSPVDVSECNCCCLWKSVSVC